MRRHLIFLILAALVALAVFAGGRANVAQALIALVDYVRDAGALGIAVFAAVYVASAVALLPGAALTLAAGFVYGPLVGTLIVSPVSASWPRRARSCWAARWRATGSGAAWPASPVSPRWTRRWAGRGSRSWHCYGSRPCSPPRPRQGARAG